MIASFKYAETRKVFTRQWSDKLPKDIQATAYRKLAMINSASALLDLRSPPGNHLEKLRGKRAGQYSIRINDRWQICFEWHVKDAFNVEIVDYHR